ncbi:MAG TPA: phosphoribosyltransferase family protein [Candidatus Limnocylindria bacterium]|nr:phosphoribosyltransferase family protein [Candidatus Limnocylindria bacterium]
MSRPVPENYREIFSAEQVQEAVRKLARELTPWAARVHTQAVSQPLALCVLRGAFLFFADLVKEIPHSVQPAFVRCQSYATAEVLRPEDEVRLNLDDLDVRQRHVLLIDDICDSGRTLAVIQKKLLEHGASEVLTAVLIHRVHPNSGFTPNFACFRHEGPEWFAGYGMDDCHWHMNYPGVYVLKPCK